MYYTQAQWILFFFIYCFIGWVWETLYVGLYKNLWVNRGFLHGPVLPIYGFGSIMILWLTLPFKDNLFYIYILGMLGATVLEYVTGAVMEQLFHMRYWDYSYRRFNLNGYISLSTSLAWGLFSVFLVEIFHPPIEKIVLAITYKTADILSLILTVIFVADTTRSVQSALDMKELMHNLAENNKSFALLETKINAAAESLSQGSDEFKSRLQRIENDIKESLMFQQYKEPGQKTRRAVIMEKLQAYKEKRARLFSLLTEKADTLIQEINLQIQSNISRPEKTTLLGLLTRLGEFKENLKQLELNLASRRDKEFETAANLIRRNPTSVSHRFKDAFEEIKALNESWQEKRKNKM